MNKFIYFLLLIGFTTVQAQELNCNVKVNFDRVTASNTQIFKTLETSLNEFVNKTKWTDKNFKQNERIECAIFINIAEFDSNNFSASIQVQSSRPVFNSTYASPLLNVNDKDFNFRYVEFENLYFNPNSFDSNLVSVIAYYSYMILGVDADSFAPQGGTPHFQIAQNIVSLAQSSGFKGWTQNEGNQNRYFLVNDMMSNTYNPIREGIYDYHSKGLDVMADNTKSGKEAIISSLVLVSKIHKVRPNAYLTRVFFDAKADEIVSIYSAGPQVTITELVDNLNRISPLNSTKWAKIKF